METENVVSIAGAQYNGRPPLSPTEGLRVHQSDFGSGGGGGGETMEPSVPLKDYIDARDEAVESRIASKLDQLPTKSTIWAAAGTIVGLLLAVAAFAGDRFDGGMSAGPFLNEQAMRQAKTDAAQDARSEMIDKKLDILLKQTAGKSYQHPPE